MADNRIKELFTRIENGTRAVFESEEYKRFLSVMSKFHRYSFRNSMLILLQNPEATYVAGYRQWQQKFKRQVRKGERGINIIAYAPQKIHKKVTLTDPDGKPLLDADGNVRTEQQEVTIPAFVPAFVFDVSQTEGEPLPEWVGKELTGKITGYSQLLRALQDVSPFPIAFEKMNGNENGYCSPMKQHIGIRIGMSEAQTIKTIIHEITHADLHAPDSLTVSSGKDRHTKEVEAESCAYIVCEKYGIDSSDYTFPYLASWSSGKELDELHASLDTIQKQAADLIDRIDQRLLELQNLQLDEKAAAEKLDQFVTKYAPPSFDRPYPFSIADQAERREILAAGIRNNAEYLSTIGKDICNEIGSQAGLFRMAAEADRQWRDVRAVLSNFQPSPLPPSTQKASIQDRLTAAIAASAAQPVCGTNQKQREEIR